MKRFHRNFNAGVAEISALFRIAFCTALLLILSAGNAGAGTRVVRSLPEARHEHVVMQLFMLVWPRWRLRELQETGRHLTSTADIRVLRRHRGHALRVLRHQCIPWSSLSATYT
jgi:hypothetical protein